MNKIIVLASVFAMCFSLSACAEKIEKNSSVAAVSSAASKASASETDGSDTDSDVLAHTTDGVIEKDTFDCSLYSFNLDSDKWLSTSDDSLDCSLMYIKDDSQGSFNVISTTDAEINEDDLSYYADVMKQTNESSGNITYTSEESTTLSGIAAYKFGFTQQQDTGDLITEQLLCIKGNDLFIITYSAAPDYFDQLKADVDLILGSFNIK